jgi:hypothetical protein
MDRLEKLIESVTQATEEEKTKMMADYEAKMEKEHSELANVEQQVR